MNNSDFKKLLNRNKYQIFLLSCPCSIPLSFASHNWFVINKKGEISRWEVAHKKWNNETRWGYLYKNLHTPNDGKINSGIEIIYGISKWHWRSKLIDYIEGDENSLAQKIVDFIENSKDTYKQKETYNFLGPNSNSYIQWIINNFPESNFKLSKNSIGRNFKYIPKTS